MRPRVVATAAGAVRHGATFVDSAGAGVRGHGSERRERGRKGAGIDSGKGRVRRMPREIPGLEREGGKGVAGPDVVCQYTVHPYSSCCPCLLPLSLLPRCSPHGHHAPTPGEGRRRAALPLPLPCPALRPTCPSGQSPCPWPWRARPSFVARPLRRVRPRTQTVEVRAFRRVELRRLNLHPDPDPDLDPQRQRHPHRRRRRALHWHPQSFPPTERVRPRSPQPLRR